METKKISNRGRPKKDYGELKNKIAQETAENKGKLGRGRPKKLKNIDDSINTKISNHRIDVSVLEETNENIHNDIKVGKISKNTKNLGVSDNKKLEEHAEYFSKVALIFSIAFCILSILYFIITRGIESNEQASPEISITSENVVNNDLQPSDKFLQMQIGFNDNSGNFVEIENIDVINNEPNVINSDIDNEDIHLINLFYDKINSKKFSDLSSITDIYLKNSDSYRAYFNANRLSNFLDKIAGGRIFIGKITELPSNKPTVKHYGYILKYKLDNEDNFRQEDWEIAIVERNGEKLIGSIMCVTTGCSRMPFFQK